MKRLTLVLLLITLGMSTGCGDSSVEPPPVMTDELRAQIEAEQAAIEEAERAHAASQK